MIYDDCLRRGVSKKYLPGPRVFEFPSNTSYDEYISIVKPYFFNDSTGEFCLANASGIQFEISKKRTHVLRTSIEVEAYYSPP